jgi:hypothetical protein
MSKFRRSMIMLPLLSVTILFWPVLGAMAAHAGTSALAGATGSGLTTVVADTTAQVDQTVSGTTDAVGTTVSDTTSTVSDTTSGATSTVSDTTSGATSTVSDTTSGATSTVSDTTSGATSTGPAGVVEAPSPNGQVAVSGGGSISAITPSVRRWSLIGGRAAASVPLEDLVGLTLTSTLTGTTSVASELILGNGGPIPGRFLAPILQPPSFGAGTPLAILLLACVTVFGVFATAVFVARAMVFSSEVRSTVP